MPAPLVPDGVDRFRRTRVMSSTRHRHRLWLAADDTIDVDALAAARATRTDVAIADALGDATHAACFGAPRAGSLAAFLQALIDDAIADHAVFGELSRREAISTRIVEDALRHRLGALATDGVLERVALSALGLSGFDADRLFASLRARTPRPSLADLFGGAELPLVVDDVDSPPTAAELRALAEHPGAIDALLAASSIPSSLPEIDAVARDVGPSTFADVSGLFVQHVLGTQVPTFDAMIARGLDPGRVVIVGVPYSTSELVAVALRRRGFTVISPALNDPRTLEAVSHAALVEACDRLRPSIARGGRLLVLDDGGKAATYLHEAFAQLRHVHIVEQTARGITVLAALPRIRWPVVDVARSLSKQHEQDHIGREVRDAVVRELDHVGIVVDERTQVRVTGAGVIGTGVARAFAALGADVMVWDSDAGRRARARDGGFTVAADRVALFVDADVVVGCTGKTSILASDLPRVQRGCALASASSRQIEIDMSPWSSPNVVTQTLCIEGEGGGRFATQVWRLPDKDVLLRHNGFPMNFNGHIETGTASSIAPTRALMLRGTAQALTLSEPGIHGLIGAPARGDRTV